MSGRALADERARGGGADGRTGAFPPVRVVREVPVPGDVPLFRHPEWADEFEWLVQGTTGRGDGAAFDLRLSGPAPVGEVLARWRALAAATGCPRVVHGQQVHGCDVLVHGDGLPGIHLAGPADGHATAARGTLLTVSVADCVPVSIVDPEGRVVALVHAGWRGIAAGILERGIEVLARLAGATPSALRVHLGPAICGDCYEVGPEVHAALGLEVPEGPTPVDLRSVLALRAIAMGVPEAAITRSAHCTRCGDSPFFSHRGGCAERQVGILGVRG